MGKFKVGDKIRKSANSASWAPIGYEATVIQSGGTIGYIDNKGNETILCALDWELSTPKFKVGDRVRVIDDRGGGKIGDVGTITSLEENTIDQEVAGMFCNISGLSGDAVGLYEYRLEPAPLFAVGDKVRFNTKKPRWVAEYTDKTLSVVGVFEDKDGLNLDVKYPDRSLTQTVISTDVTHATTDEEACEPTINEIRSLYEYPPIGSSTTGFTIPTDEEALPPKVVKRRAKAPFVFDGGVLKLDHVSTGVVSASILRDQHGSYIDLVNKRIVINDNKPKPRPAIVVLVENGQPLPSTAPKVHRDSTKATKEANRLATRYPGQEFGVFELVSKRVATVDIREAA